MHRVQDEERANVPHDTVQPLQLSDISQIMVLLFANSKRTGSGHASGVDDEVGGTSMIFVFYV